MIIIQRLENGEVERKMKDWPYTERIRNLVNRDIWASVFFSFKTVR